MTAERGDNAGVRLHVGGLARGVDPKELAALIARTLPLGASPTAEVMRDASTGIERGFGYVSVAGGEGVRAGAERAIAAYNGTRWRGNKIRVGFAKGDYLQRLKNEWDEAAAAKEAAAAAAKKISATEPYKARPSLRLRRRPGERIILVDPTPIAWTKPRRQDAKGSIKAKGKEERERHGEGGEGGDEGGPHRRKRGILGGRRRVEFPGEAAACSTKCRELWRRHLQEQAAEASAARQRSVDRFSSGKNEGAEAAAADALDGEASPRVETMEDHHDAADLLPEELPAADGIEFVWDDGGEDAAESASDGGGKESETCNSGDHTMHVRAPAAGLGEQPDKEEAEESGEDEAPAADGWGGGATEKDDLTLRQTSEAWDGSPAARAAPKKLERLRNVHGLELDDRLAEMLSDGSDDDGEEAYGDGGFDYELETARRAGIGATTAAVEEPLEGMRDRLQAETERSLGVLAELFGGDSAAPVRPIGEASGASPAPAPAQESGAAGMDDVGEASAPSICDAKDKAEGVREDVEVQKTDGQQRQQRDPPPLSEGEASGADNSSGPKTEAPGEERFVAHMSTLTDIFTVRDKLTTKKSKEEKEKDKGFKVASLFGGLAGTEEPQPAKAAADPAEKAGGFSFAFGGAVARVAPTSTRKDENTVAASTEEPGEQVSSGLHPASGPADGRGTPPTTADAPRRTETALWRPLGDVVAFGARFVRVGERDHVEAAWLSERRALTQDFKRKHKDAVKGRRGAGSGGAALKNRKRR
eukprot:g7089.t1